jgi:hypothetical protein
MSTIITDAEALAFLELPATVVDQNSASGQKILYTKATINFVVGDELIVGRGTVREEIKIIDTIQSGVSLTMTVNLEFTHSATDADTVEVEYQSAAIISAMNLAVDKIVKNHCGRCFNKEEGAIEYLDGDGDNELWLEDYPVSNVVLYIKSSDDAEFDDEEDLIDSDDYVVYSETGRIYYYGSDGFPVGYRDIKAVYNKGYTGADMPEDLKLVCRMEVKLLYNRWKEDSRGLKNYSVAGIKKSFDPELSSLSLMILNNNYIKKRI